MGQLFMMGFDGTTVTPQIRKLIEEHHLGSILLTAKNLKCIEARRTRVIGTLCTDLSQPRKTLRG
jgi:beta-N-acetylhexosaminidase